MRSRFKNIGLKLIALMAVLFVAAIVAYTQKSPAARQRPPKTMPDPPRILSFTSTPERIQAGETATLQWSTANTDQVVVGEGHPEWLQTRQGAKPLVQLLAASFPVLCR
jgi:hypothetical protein